MCSIVAATLGYAPYKAKAAIAGSIVAARITAAAPPKTPILSVLRSSPQVRKISHKHVGSTYIWNRKVLKNIWSLRYINGE